MKSSVRWKVKVLARRELSDFPSGSAIEFHEDKLYIAGDDASALLITDKKWKRFEYLDLFARGEGRIPKKEKVDLEASSVVMVDGVSQLAIFGSGSKEPRNRLVLLNLVTHAHQIVDIGVFYERLRNLLGDLNIEAAATLDDRLVLANRGNKSYPDNHLLVTDADFWRRQETAELRKFRLDLGETASASGLSGLAFSASQRCLWFTASTEDTANSYEDGKIGTSYLGVVEHADTALSGADGLLVPDVLIDLDAASDRFKGNKIESVCIQSEKPDRIKLQLVADNDTGTTQLFRVRLKARVM